MNWNSSPVVRVATAVVAPLAPGLARRHAIVSSPSDVVHSGFIAAARQDRIGLPQAPVAVTRFRVTFTQPGLFTYICALRDDVGMTGQITVVR